jgi:parvulin-like peptidyl-prolyl isomerase
MLRLLRKKKIAKKIYYGLAVIIIPAFVIWGSASVIRQKQDPHAAGIIFGQTVSFDDYRDALRSWKIQMKIQFGEKADQLASSFFNPNQAAWDRLILLHEVRRRRIGIKDEEVVTTLTQMPFLQKNGHFDPQMYDLFSKYSIGEPARSFEEQLRENLSMAKVYDQVTERVSVSEDEIKKEYIKTNEQTRVKYVFFAPGAEKDKVTTTEDEAKAYFEKTKEKFKVPPQINATYIALELKEKSSEQEKSAASDQMKRALSLAKQRGLEKAASELKMEAKETGLFGLEDPVPTLGWMPQLAIMLFDLSSGDLSKVVELKRGYYIFRIKEKRDAYVPDYKEAKDKVKEALVLEKAKDLSRQKAEDFLAKAKAPGASFEQAAQLGNLEIKETPLFSREAYIPEIGMAQELKDIAFKLERDQVADSVMTLDQGSYVLKSLETVPFDQDKFKKEKDEFSKQLLEQKRNKIFNDFFSDLKKKANLVDYVGDSPAN